jgi:hypothetical protein
MNFRDVIKSVYGVCCTALLCCGADVNGMSEVGSRGIADCYVSS